MQSLIKYLTEAASAGAAKTDPKKFWASNTTPRLEVLASFRLQTKPN